MEAGGGGGPHLAAQAAASHRADWPGFQARWKEERLWPDRLHGAVERENGRLKRELDFSESAVRPDLARLDAASRVAAVGGSGALTAESAEDLG